MLCSQFHRRGDKAAHHIQILVQQRIYGVQAVTILLVTQAVSQIGEILCALIQDNSGSLQCPLQLCQIRLGRIRKLVDAIQSLVHGIQKRGNLGIRISYGIRQVVQSAFDVVLVVFLDGGCAIHHFCHQSVQLFLGSCRIGGHAAYGCGYLRNR